MQDITEVAEDEILNLEANDIFFIDSSHILTNFGDVEYIYSYLFPLIPKGVIIHVHDIFLPYNYPSDWLIDWKCVLTEQHLLGAWLDNRDGVDVLTANFWNLCNEVQIPSSVEYRVGGSFWFRMHQ